MIIQHPITVVTLTDAFGNSQVRVVNECNDSMPAIGGEDRNGKYHQFDSTEAYYITEWAKEHGFTVKWENRTITVEVPEPMDPWEAIKLREDIGD